MSAPASPCVQVCRLRGDGLCEGCLRTIDEIIGWPSATASERQAILDRVALRRNGAISD